MKQAYSFNHSGLQGAMLAYCCQMLQICNEQN